MDGAEMDQDCRAFGQRGAVVEDQRRNLSERIDREQFRIGIVLFPRRRFNDPERLAGERERGLDRRGS
jgi:hypothetical protein